MNRRVTRRDVGRLGKFERTASGGVRVPATITSVGVFPYESEDGTTVLEARLPEFVFRPDSLATLEDAPVTADHPSPDNGAEGFVTTSNWRDLSIGSVRDVRVDGEDVVADVVLLDVDAIAAVERGDLVEVSLGYACELVEQSGTFNGERFTHIQRNISYNHAALGPRGWGRLGSDVSLRLDSRRAADPLAAVHAKNAEYARNVDARFAMRKHEDSAPAVSEKKLPTSTTWPEDDTSRNVGADADDEEDETQDDAADASYRQGAEDVRSGVLGPAPKDADAKLWASSVSYRRGFVAQASQDQLDARADARAARPARRGGSLKELGAYAADWNKRNGR